MYIVLIDNFGELYYWLGSRDYSEIQVVPANDGSYKREDMNKFILQPKESRTFAFTDDFIDILKASYIPFDSGRFEINRSNKPTIGIESYIYTLLGKNKVILDTIDCMITEKSEALEENIEYRPLTLSSSSSIQSETNLLSSIANREVILSAAEKRLDQNKMRGFTSSSAYERYNLKLNSTIDKTAEELKNERISYSWAYES